MKLKITITGPKIHEVGYRPFLLGGALDLEIERFKAANAVKDGTQIVVVTLEGSEDQVNAFKEFVQNEKPESAEVSDIVFTDFDGYVMRTEAYSMWNLNMQITKGVNAIQRMDRRQGTMLDKQDTMIEKLDDVRADVVGEIRALRGDFQPGLDEQIRQLREDFKQLRAEFRAMRESPGKSS